jgi:hypothetical protein
VNDDFSYQKNISNDKVIKLSNRKEINKEDPARPLIENESYRELYKNFSVVANEQTLAEIDEILHNKTHEGKEYKYGLPAKNEISFNELMIKPEEETIPKTSTENLFELLELDKLSSYESLLLKFKETFNHGNNTSFINILEADMYGNVVKAGSTNHKVFEYGIPIPINVIKDELVMHRLRRRALYNVDLPGNIEDVHPNKFIAGKYIIY